MSHASRAGFLIKQGHFRKNWLKRWWVLRDGVVTYAESDRAARPKGSIELRYYNVRVLAPREKSGTPTPYIIHLFPLEPGMKQYYMCSVEADLARGENSVVPGSSPRTASPPRSPKPFGSTPHMDSQETEREGASAALRMAATLGTSGDDESYGGDSKSDAGGDPSPRCSEEDGASEEDAHGSAGGGSSVLRGVPEKRLQKQWSDDDLPLMALGTVNAVASTGSGPAEGLEASEVADESAVDDGSGVSLEPREEEEQVAEPAAERGCVITGWDALVLEVVEALLKREGVLTVRAEEPFSGERVPISLEGVEESSGVGDKGPEEQAAASLIPVLNAHRRSACCAMLGSCDQSRALLAGCAERGVTYVSIVCSGIGRRREQSSGADEVERELKSSAEACGLECTVIRRNLLFQSILMWSPDIATSRVVRLPLPVDACVSWLDAADVAELAVNGMCSREHDGETYTLTGCEELCMAQMAAVLQEEIGSEFRAETIPEDVARAALRRAGVGSMQEDLLMAEFAAAGEGRCRAISDDMEVATDRVPCRFRAWVHGNKHLFE